MLSPAQILDRISKRLDLLKGGRDADARQQTLRATIEWSYDLLNRAEQTLFARLSVFAGGCTLESAEAVCDADLDVLQSLVDKSLVGHADERFTMLETIREYAAERLAESSTAEAIRRRHAEHLLALAEESETHLLGRGAEEWHDRLEREYDNLRAALDYFESNGDIQVAMRLTGAMSEFWDQRAHHSEGMRRFARLLAADDRPTDARAKALDGASTMAGKSSEMLTAIGWSEEALAIHRALGDERGMGISLWGLGYLRVEQGEPESAEELLTESIRLLRGAGDEASLLWATRTLAFTYLTLGDLARARPLYEATLRGARAAGDDALQGATLGALSKIAVDEGRLVDAVSISRESLRTLGEVGDRLLAVSVICSAASVLTSIGRSATAARLMSYADVEYEESRAREPWVDTMNSDTLSVIRAQLDEAAFADAWEQGRKLTTDKAVALALGEMP